MRAAFRSYEEMSAEIRGLKDLVKRQASEIEILREVADKAKALLSATSATADAIVAQKSYDLYQSWRKHKDGGFE